jgi:hypothetical protein
MRCKNKRIETLKLDDTSEFYSNLNPILPSWISHANADARETVELY